MNKRLLFRWLLPLFIIALALLLWMLLLAGKPTHKKPQAKEKAWQVDVMKLQAETLTPSLTLYGKVESSALLKAAAPAAGVIEQLLVQPGDVVQAGQLLLAMDQRDFISAQIRAQADVDDARAQLQEQALRQRANIQALQQEKVLLRLAKQEVQRIERLKKNNLSSESALSDAHEKLGRQQLAVINRQLDVDRYSNMQQQLEAGLARAQATLQQAKLAIERSRVVADFAAVVVEVPVAQGDLVRSGDRLLSLYAPQSLRVRASIPVRYQHELQQAMQSDISLHATAQLDGGSIRLSLLRLAGAASLSGIDGYFSFIGDSADLRLGNLLKLDLLRPPQANVFAVPFSAIYGNNRVFVLRDGRMVAIDVESVGQYDRPGQASQLLIRSVQIDSGDQLITTHLPNAQDGLKVKLTQGATDA